MKEKFIIKPKEIIDPFLEKQFKHLFDYSDELKNKVMKELFLQYFKNNFLNVKNEDLFLNKEEKHLQYWGRNTFDPTIEFNYLIEEMSNYQGKLYYAEMGGRNCIILSTKTKKSEKKFLIIRAKEFYNSAKNYTQSENYQFLFKLISKNTKTISEGLENLIYLLNNGMTKEEQEQLFKKITSEEKGFYLKY